MNIVGDGETDDISLTKEEKDLFFLSQSKLIHTKYEDYKKGYQNSIMEVYKKYNIINIKSTTNPPKKIQTDTPSTSQAKVDPPKEVPRRKDTNVKEVEKYQPYLNLKNELSKVKIYVPLTKLMKKDVYRNQIIKAIKIEEGTNMVNISDDKPRLLFGPEVKGISQDGNVPLFYVSLNIHDFILHNARLDSRASHNLIPNVIMEKTWIGYNCTI